MSMHAKRETKSMKPSTCTTCGEPIRVRDHERGDICLPCGAHARRTRQRDSGLSISFPYLDARAAAGNALGDAQRIVAALAEQDGPSVMHIAKELAQLEASVRLLRRRCEQAYTNVGLRLPSPERVALMSALGHIHQKGDAK